MSEQVSIETPDVTMPGHLWCPSSGSGPGSWCCRRSSGSDALQPLDQVTLESYEDADHAFDNPDFHLYDEDASRLAWTRTTNFLATHLPV